MLYIQWNGRAEMMCYGMAANSMGLLGVSVREMKALTVKMETVTLIGKSG
jgi:hypothetical protein